MSINVVEVSNERRCEYCKSDKTYTAVTKSGTQYPKWNSHPSYENGWIYGDAIGPVC